MATITDAEACRIMFQLLKTREVTNATPYNNVDKLSGPATLRFLNSIWGVNHPPNATGTVDEKALFALRWVKQQVKQAHIRWESRQAGQSAQATAAATATAEADGDLGT